MKEFECDPNCEVIGGAILSFIKALPESSREIGREILAKHGLNLDEIRPDAFYPLQAYLSAMKDVEELLGRFALSQMGEKIISDLEFPPDWKTLEDVTANMDPGYQMQHRGAFPGRYACEAMESRAGLKRAKVICDNPHACAFNRGTLVGLTKRFPAKGGGTATVIHDDSAPCKAKGGESCSFIMEWLES